MNELKEYHIALFGAFNFFSYGDTMFPVVFREEMVRCLNHDVSIDLFAPETAKNPYNGLSEVYAIDDLESKHNERKYDCLVIGGGEMIHFSSIVYRTEMGVQKKIPIGEFWEKPQLIADKLEIPVIWNSVGVAHDFKNMEELERIRQCCSRILYISVRDSYSKYRLETQAGIAGVHKTVDMLWLFNKYYSKDYLETIKNKLSERYGFLNKGYFVLQHGTSYAKMEIAAEIEKIKEKYELEVLLLPVNYCHEDNKVIFDILEKYPNFRTINEVLQPVEIMAVIAGASFFMGTSLHGNLTAMSYLVPNLCWNMYPEFISKIDGMFDTVEESELVISKVDEIVSKFELIFQRGEEYYLKIKNRIEAIQKIVEKNFDEIAMVIKNRQFWPEVVLKSMNQKLHLAKISISNDRFTESKIIEIGNGMLVKEFELEGNNDYYSGTIMSEMPFYLKKISVILEGREVNCIFDEKEKSKCYYRKQCQFYFRDNSENKKERTDIIVKYDIIVGDEVDKELTRMEIENLRSANRELETQVIRLEGHVDYMLEKERSWEREKTDTKLYINQLLQTEQELKQELNNKEGHIQLLLQSERDLKHEIEKIQSAKLFRIISVIWRIEGKLLPTGSKRRAVLKSSLWLLRHPVRGIRGIVKTGHIRGLEAKPELTVEKPVLRKLEEYETLVFQKAEKPLVSIIVPVYNEFEYTYICLESILKNSGNVSYEIIIADDCSTDITAEIDKVVKNIVVARTQENLRFLRNCNNAAGYARGNYILFLNNDTKVLENWLEPLVTLIESDSAIGMVGSKLIYADGKLQEAGGICWCDGTAWNYGNRQDASAPEYNYVKDVDYISGASLMIRKTLWEEIGGFDENFAPAYCEDSDLAFEVRKHGYRVVYQPKSVVVHFEGVSNGTDVSSGVKQYQVENSRKLQQKWAEEFAGQYPNGKNVFRARERSKDKKIVLFIDHYVPHFDEDAGSKTIYQYLQMFVKKGYLVKFIGDNFYQHEPYTTVLQQMGIEVLYGSYYAQHVFDWIRANKEQIDYAFLNRPHISVKYIDMLRRETNIKTIYYGHDLHFLRNQREYELTGNIEKKKEAEEWRKKELRLMHSADISYYPSYIEKEEIHKIDPSISVKAITAYVYDQFKEDINYDFASKEGVLFVGGFRHDPNADAVLWFVEEIWPLIRKEQEMNFYIVGSYVTEEIQMLDGKNGIVVKGFVSDEELSSLYAQCKMVVVPLRYGAGVKGKVVEAVYNGMPIVTTSVGAEGIENIEKAVVIEDNPEKFAKRVTELYRDNEGLKALAEATQVLVKEQFSTEAVWNIIKDDFC